ncbi:Copper-exporting P-type ATPase A [Acholeplasma oculi]|uniref:Heavy metal-associated domain containing protein n=1 Tax=Acholeplasma oculi TaxID=35623 RepID=A0A061AA94_9MOLU|nr:heavy metal-associated domain-containing protein [Acholeplasma oculi]CDR30309.1 Heavy metal-associated domain containing protein [Acholeplasma oculi]SKC43088.1 Copper chaperone CopZ [Acholeplasma oculi]SUT88770.1 Copper-exporting P-type ATPase A [Acholeplasma oculi]
MEKIFKVETLTCPSCVKRIENGLKKEKGVIDVTVKFNASKVSVVFDETVQNETELKNALNNLGYPVLE